MVIFGVDAHKRSHTVAVINEAGAQLGTLTVTADTTGHLEALKWATKFGPDRRWALEDSRLLTRRLETDLLNAGETVQRVPPKLMAQTRRSARTPGKSDPIDALAVARAAAREPDLPMARLDEPSRELKLLVDHRQSLVTERTRIQNRLLWRLHELAIGTWIKPRSLDRFKVLTKIRQELETHTGIVADLARSDLARCHELTIEANTLQRRITTHVTAIAPNLLAVPGCGALTAAKLIGETADITRFKTKDAYARHNGTAPIPAWSGNTTHHRINKGGNRQLNTAIYRIAITQLAHHDPARTFIHTRITNGKPKQDTIRALRRHISDAVYKAMTKDAQHHQPTPQLT